MDIGAPRRLNRSAMAKDSTTTGHDSARGGGARKDGVLGFGAAWAMAVGGMIGGGIFATLGVVVSVAGAHAWASFLIGGLVALATGYSLVQLTVRSDKAGGLYEFLLDAGEKRAAGWSAWILIAGYTLTVAVYAFTFGAYVANALGGPAWLPQALSTAVILIIAGINLMGAGEASLAEIIAVWTKLIVLCGFAAIGIAGWAPAELSPSGPAAPAILGPIVGAATVFMAYEGFELLSYDYDEMDDRETLMPRVMPAAIIATMFIYIAVMIGTAMLVGADTLIAKREVAVAEAGQAALGTAGLYIATLAAAFSTASAINATLFSTSRLGRQVANDGALPQIFAKEDSSGVPAGGILLISGASIALALLGGLGSLIQWASFVFLGAFGWVNLLGWTQNIDRRWIAGAGLLGCAGSAVILALHMASIV